MASKQMLIFAAAAALAVAFLPALAVATERTQFLDLSSYIAVFKYGNASHTVVEVGGPDFNACTKPAANANVWSSGEDRVTLDKAGRRLFFCGVGDHCTRNMKLKITAVETAAPAPEGPPARFGSAAAAVTELVAAVLVL